MRSASAEIVKIYNLIKIHKIGPSQIICDNPFKNQYFTSELEK